MLQLTQLSYFDRCSVSLCFCKTVFVVRRSALVMCHQLDFNSSTLHSPNQINVPLCTRVQLGYRKRRLSSGSEASSVTNKLKV